MRSLIREILVPTSHLISRIKPGVDALGLSHRRLLDQPLRSEFADSLDLDEALRPEYPQQNRWDYLLGHLATSRTIGLEPHAAVGGEVSIVIAKKQAAIDQLLPHLRPGRGVRGWFWIASNKVEFADTEKAVRQLDQAGIRFVRRKLREQDLEVPQRRRRR